MPVPVAFTFAAAAKAERDANAGAATAASASHAHAHAHAHSYSHGAFTSASTGPSSAPSAAAAAAPFPSAASSSSPSASFLRFVRGELLLDLSDPSTPPGAPDGPSQLVYNFLVLPWFLERLLSLGFFICLDCFLHLFTVLPLRCACALASIAQAAMARITPARGRGGAAAGSGSGGRPAPSRWLGSVSAGQVCDLARGLLLATCWCGLAFINMSRMYHYIRGQSVLKLYVIFNMLQISDKLFCSFGEDILESLFASIVALATPREVAAAAAAGGRGRPPASKPVQAMHVLFHFAISVLYVCQSNTRRSALIRLLHCCCCCRTLRLRV